MSLSSLLSLCARSRRVPSKGWKVLTGKHRPGYYKGKGAAKTGIHSTTRGFQIVPSMLPQYVVPELKGFSLKPYVANYSADDVQQAAQQQEQQSGR
jgi:large subunit ribosomal protein L41